MTAQTIMTSCTMTANGYVAKSTSGPPLFFLAEDGMALQAALHQIQTSVCCGCTQ
jgi:hypothetical protein